MPYKADICGIYKIVNMETGQCYVGQSQRVRKRINEHFRLLRLNKHSNVHLQRAFNKHGAECFYGALEVECSDFNDLDMLENEFLSGRAQFDEPSIYNIADFSKAPMRGRTHSEEVRQRIRLGRRASTFNYQSQEYRDTLSRAQRARFLSDPKFVAKVKYVLDNPHMSYVERARVLNAHPSSVRRLAIKYRNFKGEL